MGDPYTCYLCLGTLWNIYDHEVYCDKCGNSVILDRLYTPQEFWELQQHLEKEGNHT